MINSKAPLAACLQWSRQRGSCTDCIATQLQKTEETIQMHFCKIETLKVKQNYKRMEWKLPTAWQRDAKPLPGNPFGPLSCPSGLQISSCMSIWQNSRSLQAFLPLSVQDIPKVMLEVDMRTFFFAPNNRKRLFPSIYVDWLGIAWSLSLPKLPGYWNLGRCEQPQRRAECHKQQRFSGLLVVQNLEWTMLTNQGIFREDFSF